MLTRLLDAYVVHRGARLVIFCRSPKKLLCAARLRRDFCVFRPLSSALSSKMPKRKTPKQR